VDLRQRLPRRRLDRLLLQGLEPVAELLEHREIAIHDGIE